jgi:hypothetical protein
VKATNLEEVDKSLACDVGYIYNSCTAREGRHDHSATLGGGVGFSKGKKKVGFEACTRRCSHVETGAPREKSKMSAVRR